MRFPFFLPCNYFNGTCVESYRSQHQWHFYCCAQGGAKKNNNFFPTTIIYSSSGEELRTKSNT